ncbi:MAG: carboxypeptidase regulatory-like domain-containing protein [Bryobacteraceae bacterium]|nr:carboxypeptidase regulatory-like domain-containing protein [Bryobacteraceae bacterium]
MKLLILAAFTTLAAFPQTAQLTGRVLDSSGAAMPGAAITVRSLATSAERATETNDSGLYTIPLLQPGAYEVTARKDGFKPVTQTGVVLAVDQRAELSFTLQVGTLSEQIEVKATISRLNTVEASQGQVIDNQRIVEMPLNGRNYIDLALMSGGAVQSTPGSRIGGFSAGGQRVSQNNYIMDGVDNNSVELAAAGRRAEMVQPSIDAIAEFKVQTNAYAAEFGRGMGGVVNLTIKSGTNELHGTAFEFLRNEKLDAKNFFDPASRPKPPFKRNQYGFSIGGPVVIPKIYNGRNRTFFFADYEATRIRETATIVSNLPTLRMRNGDFGEIAATLLDPSTGQPFADKVIPASRFDPVARQLIQLYPNPVNSNLAANFTNLSPRIQDVDKWDVRIDQNISSKDTAFWRLSKHDTNLPDTPNLPAPAYGGGNLDFITEGYNTGAGWNHVFTPNLIMAVRAGWNFALFKRNNPASALGTFFNEKYGIPGATERLDGGFSQMNITGYRALGIGNFNPVDRDSQNRQVAGDLSWVRGRHTVKTGLSFIRSQNAILNIRGVLGAYTFDSRYTRNGAADFLLGLASGWNWQSAVNVQMRTWTMGTYLQDDWKINNRLTVNLGLRYEVSPPWIERYDKMGIFDIDTNPASPTIINAKSGGSRADRALVTTDTNNFMPRIGFAFKVNEKTVIRSGYGMFFAYMENMGDSEYLIGNPPFAFGVTLAGSNTAPALLLRTGPAAGATDLTRATGLQFSSYERNPPMSVAHQWNLNIQREIGADWLFEVGYSGSRGLHLVRQYEANFSPAGPGAVNNKRIYSRVAIPGTSIIASPLGNTYSHRYDGNSIYHAMIAKVEKRFSNGFTVLSSYTFSKNIGDTCGTAVQGNTTGCGYQNIFDLRPERSLDNQDIPHRFVTSALYDIPAGKGRSVMSNAHPVVETILGGWSVGSIVTWASNVPLNLTVQGNPANSAGINVVNRPDVTGPAYSGERTLARDFNTSAFVANRQFQYGNAGRNILRQRSHFNWDFSALKSFTLAERLRLQFRFEAFSFSNTPRFGAPGNVVGTPQFGVITSAATPRNLQFGLKLIW